MVRFISLALKKGTVQGKDKVRPTAMAMRAIKRSQSKKAIQFWDDIDAGKLGHVPDTDPRMVALWCKKVVLELEEIEFSTISDALEACPFPAGNAEIVDDAFLALESSEQYHAGDKPKKSARKRTPKK